MVRVFLRHEVADYSVWRSQYDTFDAERRAMGVVNDNVFRNAEDEHEVTVTHDFETLAADAIGRPVILTATTLMQQMVQLRKQ